MIVALTEQLADAIREFCLGGLLEGLKLIGFAVWARRSGTGWSVALLRPSEDIAAQDRVLDAILEEYAAEQPGTPKSK